MTSSLVKLIILNSETGNALDGVVEISSTIYIKFTFSTFKLCQWKNFSQTNQGFWGFGAFSTSTKHMRQLAAIDNFLW